MPAPIKHVHITEDGQVVGTVFLDRDGRAVDDGSAPAFNAIHNMPHRIKSEHGEALLDAIVKGLDRATRVGTYYCREPSCLAGAESDEDESF